MMKRHNLNFSSLTEQWPQTILFLLGFLSVIIQINVPSVFFKSGQFALFGSDLVGVLVYFFALLMLFVRGLPKTKVERCLLITLIIFFVFCSIISASRFYMGISDTQSLQVPRANLFSLWPIILVFFFDIRRESLEKAICLFAIVLAIIALPISLMNHRSTYLIFQSTAIRSTALLVCLPFHAFAVKLFDINFKTIGHLVAFFFHFVVSILLVIISGARANFLLLLGVILFLGGYALIKKNKISFWAVLSTVIVAVFIAFIIAAYNPLMRYGMQRNMLLGTPYKQLLTFQRTWRFQVSDQDEQNKKMDDLLTKIEQANKDAEESKADSSMARREVWKKVYKDWIKNPLLGTGAKQYTVTYEHGKQSTVIIPAHNFILEYLSTYGIIGLVLWLAIFFVPLWRIRRIISNMLGVLLALFIVFSIALVQPIMINPTMLTLVYGFLSCVLLIAKENETFSLVSTKIRQIKMNQELPNGNERSEV